MVFHLWPRVIGGSFMGIRTSVRSFRSFASVVALGVCTLILPLATVQVFAQGTQKQGQTEFSPAQRLNVMRSKLDSMRRSLDSAIAGMNTPATADKKANPDDPRERLRGLNKEVNSLLSEVNDLYSKQEKAERYDTSRLDGLETSVTELNTRVQVALQETASARTDQTSTASTYHPKQPKKSLLGRLNVFKRGGGDDKYEDLTSTVAPGRDRVLFQDATKEVRKGGYETGRLLFNTIITTYPDSPYLALAKLAIADSFYLEGGTSSLIQAGQAYQDWLTFFPTDPLADAAALKVAESEMRQMGLSDRDISHARKAEQRLKVLLQQYPQTKLRPTVEARLRQVQDNLAMHNLQVARFYYDRYRNQKGGLRGAQDRLREIVEKYPNFCFMDEVLFRYATTYQQEEEPDEAAKYYQQLVRDYPNSEYVDKAKEQLNIIGASIPEPDPTKKNLAPCERPTFMQNIMQQISGNANVEVDDDGILITRHGEGQDLIDIAIANNGDLPPQPVTQRTPRAPVNQTPPAPQPDPAPDKKKVGISIQSTPNGPQPDRINPAVPSTPTGTAQPQKKPEPTPSPAAKSPDS
jgi:outer membrane protein assembly factor BamD